MNPVPIYTFKSYIPLYSTYIQHISRIRIYKKDDPIKKTPAEKKVKKGLPTKKVTQKDNLFNPQTPMPMLKQAKRD